jgi:hypothetical protein
VFTVVPVFADPLATQWLSLGFLRALSACSALARLTALPPFRGYAPELTLAGIRSALRALSLIVVTAGAVFSLEVLGELPWLEPSDPGSEDENVAFAKVAYWVFMTVTTVGDSQFLPMTFLSRLVAALSVIAGAVLVFSEAVALVRLRALQVSGAGRAPACDGPRVVVVGRGLGTPSGLLQSLLLELLHPGRSLLPDVIIMTNDMPDTSLRKWASKSLSHIPQHRLTWLVGNATEEADLERSGVKGCALAYVLPDPFCGRAAEEDTFCVISALAVKHYAPSTQLRLLLLQSEGKVHATSLGIASTHCFSAHEVSVSLMAQGARCTGFTTFVTNMLRSFASKGLPVAAEEALGKAVDGAVDSVPSLLQSYLAGASFSIFAVRLRSKHQGRRILDLNKACYLKTGALPIAYQRRGRLEVAPSDGVAEESQLCLVLAKDSNAAEYLGAVLDASALGTEEKDCATMGGSVGKGDAEHRILRCAAAGASSPEKKGKTTADIIVTLNNCTPTKNLAHFDEWHASADGHTPRTTFNRPRLSTPKGIVIVALRAQPPWQRIVTLLRSLRAPHLPVIQPVVVLSSEPPPEGVLDLFEQQDVTFMTGPVLRESSLAAAGVASAASVLALGGDDDAASQRDDDGSVIVLAGLLEHGFASKGLDGKGAGPAVLLELACSSSMRLLPCQSSLQPRPNTDIVTSPAMEIEDAGLVGHPHLASGQVFCLEAIGATLGQAFHVPAIVELLEALCLPEKRLQSSMPWQITVPETYWGRPFSELVVDFLQSHSAVAIALHRLGDSSLEEPRVFTLPGNEMLLKRGDSAIVLGSEAFGLDALRQGFLKGTPPPSPKLQPAIPEEPDCSQDYAVELDDIGCNQKCAQGAEWIEEMLEMKSDLAVLKNYILETYGGGGGGHMCGAQQSTRGGIGCSQRSHHTVAGQFTHFPVKEAVSHVAPWETNMSQSHLPGPPALSVPAPSNRNFYDTPHNPAICFPCRFGDGTSVARCTMHAGPCCGTV